MVKEYFIKCPEHPGVTTMIGTSNEKYQTEIEAHIIIHKIKDDNIVVGGKLKTVSTLSKKFEGSIDNPENIGDSIGRRKQTKT